MTSISLCIPVYNSADFLPGLFARLLALQPMPAEILLLDDASPDQSALLMQTFAAQAEAACSVRILSNKANTGIAAAYNRLVQEARSDWVQILDADDHPVEPDFFDRVQEALAPDLDLLVTALHSNSRLLHWGAGVLSAAVPSRPPRWWPLLGSFATRAGVLYRRERLVMQPFPDPAFPGSDVLHFLRFRHGRNCRYTRDAHVFYRVHAGATSSQQRSYREYRAGLAGLDRMTRFTHSMDLSLRTLGQRLGRRST